MGTSQSKTECPAPICTQIVPNKHAAVVQIKSDIEETLDKLKENAVQYVEFQKKLQEVEANLEKADASQNLHSGCVVACYEIAGSILGKFQSLYNRRVAGDKTIPEPQLSKLVADYTTKLLECEKMRPYMDAKQ